MGYDSHAFCPDEKCAYYLAVKEMTLEKNSKLENHKFDTSEYIKLPDSNPRLKDLEQKLSLAVSALNFYANKENWSGSMFGIPSCITNQDDHDLIEFEGEKIHCGGKIARQTLAKITEGTRK
jgi:hypothetical protein